MYGRVKQNDTISIMILTKKNSNQELREALNTLVLATISRTSANTESDVFADLDQLSNALYRTAELEAIGDLSDESLAAHERVNKYALENGLPTFPHCEGCGSINPPWSDQMAENIKNSLK